MQVRVRQPPGVGGGVGVGGGGGRGGGGGGSGEVGRSAMFGVYSLAACLQGLALVPT